MRRLAAGLALLVVLLPVARGSVPAAADDSGVLYVTSTTDGPGTCPHPSNCTLKTAIAVVNSGSAATTIRFDAGVFPAGSETVIAVGSAPLPALTRPGAAVDGAGAGVVLRGGSASLSTPQDGLRLAGAGTSVRGLTFEGFTGACVVADGDGSAVGGSAGNTFRGCGVAVRVSGAAVSVSGNEISGPAEGERAGTGVAVTASGSVIGGSGAAANRFTRLEHGVKVAGSAGGVTGTRIEGNDFDDIAGICVALEPGSSGTLVSANSFRRCGTGISVAAANDLPASSRNTFRANTFAELPGPAIEVATGANGGVGHPSISRATPAGIQGTACPGCVVEIYLAAHTPGSSGDYGTVPLGPPVAASASGQFAASLPVSPGQWIIATATDADGNTSTFGASARVGAGAVVCGNVHLLPGWNHVAYFGSQPLLLGDAFPSSANPAVTAIYEAIDGTNGYRRWLAATPAGRTLAALEPGREYWFLATTPVTLEGGFSVSFPVPAPLQAGWNDVVYIGGSADPRDAFASLGDRLLQVAKWDAARQRWLRYGDGRAPAWALELPHVEACSVYQVLMSEPATLVPLQP
jgi:hypothetical protein